MHITLYEWFSAHGYRNALLLTNAAMIVSLVLVALLLHWLGHHQIFPRLQSRLEKVKSLWWRTVAEHLFFSRLWMVLQGMVVITLAQVWLNDGAWQKGIVLIAAIWCLLFTVLSLFSLLDIVQTYVERRNVNQHLPLRGLFQGVKLALSVAAVLLLISMLSGQSPLLLLSGLGAMTAVLMLIFKDPIMGLVAGVQLSVNRMLAVGDWLEMPKYNADGEVVDIALTTVKVRNWDNTMTTVPTYALIADSFKNWRAMSESGGRRIKRSFFIDAASVHFLSDEEYAHLSESTVLRQYLQEKAAEIDTHNRSREHATLDARNLTNLGTLRAYLERYLAAHPRIRQDMTCMVRQLEATPNGIPLEIYAFTNTVQWLEYESIQSDIFDYVYAVVPEFGLRLFQAPAGYDLRQIGNEGIYAKKIAKGA